MPGSPPGGRPRVLTARRELPKVRLKPAGAANRTAQEALALARAADLPEQTRQRAENLPVLNVVRTHAKGTPVLTTVTFKNEEPLSYKSITVRADFDDAETKRLVRGIGAPDALKHEAALARAAGENITTTLVFAHPHLGGKRSFL